MDFNREYVIICFGSLGDSPPPLLMCCLYVLKSEKDGKLYIGVTTNLKRRLVEHNSGANQSTEHRGQFKLVYCEAYCDKTEALTREKKLKQFKNAYAA